MDLQLYQSVRKNAVFEMKHRNTGLTVVVFQTMVSHSITFVALQYIAPVIKSIECIVTEIVNHFIRQYDRHIYIVQNHVHGINCLMVFLPVFIQTAKTFSACFINEIQNHLLVDTDCQIVQRHRFDAGRI